MALICRATRSTAAEDMDGKPEDTHARKRDNLYVFVRSVLVYLFGFSAILRGSDVNESSR